MSLELKGVCKEFGDFKVRDVNLAVGEGEYFVVLGPTGAGKTLLLELIAGFHRPDEGRIYIDGIDVTDEPPEKRRVGYVPQSYTLFPHMTVEENIGFGLKVRGVKKEERQKLVERLMDSMGISKLRGRLPMTLSGGERQRVAIARALAVNPRLLLLDEPLSALDPRTKEPIRRELRRVHEAFGVTVIHVTHDQLEALMLADRLGIMNDGRLVQVGEPREVFLNPKDEFVARFVGFENLFEGEVEAVEGGLARVRVGDLVIEAVGGGPGACLVGIRPEDVTVSLKPLSSSARNSFRGRVVEVEDMGALISLSVDVGIPFRALVTKRSFTDMGLRVGSEVYLTFKASSVRLIRAK